MDYFCDVFDETFKLNSKNNHLISLIHIQYAKNFEQITLLKIHISSTWKNYLTILSLIIIR